MNFWTHQISDTSKMDIMSQLSPLSSGLIDELAAFMVPGSEGCYVTQPVDARRNGGHQLPESPPDSGSENPYSPSENHAVHTIAVPQTTLNPEYSMLVHEHLQGHDILHSNSYIYEGLKSDSMHDVVVLQDQDIMELGSVRHDLILADQMSYQNKYMPDLEQSMINPQMVASHEILTPVFASTPGLQEPSSKKRKHSPDNSQVKCEPAALSPESVSQHMPRAAPSSADGSEAGDDLPLQCIRFATFQQASWHTLYDCNYKQLPTISYVVGADKGFNFSPIDEAFVCQKKNHFQVTCQIQPHGEPQYVKTGDGSKKIIGFRLHFFGVKAEDPTQEVRVEQSQSDRTKKPFHPVPVELRREGSKMTVGRLHFAETTNNNMRKKGRPNPDQRHFQLVVALRAQTQQGDFTVAAQASDRIIVRASNPGQFESDCAESWWQRGVSENSVHFTGRVGINTDRPDESCVINGNLKVMGHVVQPSDARAKHNIEELDTAQQLKNVQNIRVVKFNYDPSFAEHSGLLGFDPSSPTPQTDTGVIAQEVRRVLPEAVKEAGDVTLPNGDTIQKFLVVNKDRIFMENLGAVKELCKVTGNLESRIHQLERINKRLCGIQRRDSARSSISNDSHFSVLSSTSRSYSDCNNKDQLRDIARNIRRHECCHKLSHNSPKYTRKQCKNCHGASRYGKFYNYNKTCVRYYNKNDKSDSGSCNFPTYVETRESSPVQKLPDQSFSTLKSKDTCLWLKEESYACSNSRLALCCKRKDRFGDDTELISNKFLQIVITILIFIMAVCLVVMSALYFKEHRELVSMREIRRDKYSDAPAGYRWDGKVNSAYRATPPDPNQIHNTKLSQHPKSAREKAPLKTTQEYVTTVTPAPPRATTTPFPIRIVKPWNIEQQPRAIRDRLEVILTHRTFENLIGSCAYASNDNKLDAECQLSCPDPPQTYENQEPLERTSPEKENETFESLPKLTIPVTPERNLTDSKLKSEKVALKKQIRDDSTNYIEMSKQNGTDGGRRIKRAVRKVKRQTNEALPEGASKDWSSDDQNDDIEECESTTVGVYSPLLGNTSQVTERACSFAVYNYTYTVPLAQCLHNKHAHITLRTTTLTTQLVLCDLRCKYESAGVVKGCRASWDAAAPQRSLDTWTSKVKLDCNTSTAMKIRAGNALENLCSITPEDKIPFSEYNFHLVQSCPN